MQTAGNVAVMETIWSKSVFKESILKAEIIVQETWLQKRVREGILMQPNRL